MDAIASTSSVHARYPWLLAYRSGGLYAYWQRERDAILEADPRPSKVRAGMLAQARITVQGVEEYSAFERYAMNGCTAGGAQELALEEEELYGWLVAQRDLRADLVRLTLIGSYLPDEDLYRARREGECWWQTLVTLPL